MGGGDELADEAPFEFTPPFFWIARAEEDRDEVGLRSVEVGQIDVEIEPGKLGFVKLVIKHAVASDAAGEPLRDGLDNRSILAGERQCYAESFSARSGLAA